MIEFTDVAVPNASVIAYLTATGFLSLILCYLAPLIGRALGLMDDPGAKAHSLHARPTPLIGGFAVVLPSFLLSSVYAICAGFLIGGGGSPLSSKWVYLLVATLMLVGAVDDRVQLSARQRLAIKVPAFILFTYLNPAFSIEQLTAPAFGVSVSLGYLAAPFSALCLLALTNAVNMADGRNGLVIGLSLIWCLTLSFYLPEFLRVPVLGVSVSLLVTGIYNLRGRLFLGDSGTYSLAALVGIMSLYVHDLTPQAGGISSTQLATLFAIPGLDMLRLIYERAARGASPMSSDHDHLHHRLERHIGWGWGLPVYLAMAGGPILIACSTPNMGSPGLISASLLYCAAIFVTREQRQRFGDRSGAAANSE
jgi:UDP-GlcNAc:undecaprenyl-phosphate GlcNAc-1-phosphate transferase